MKKVAFDNNLYINMQSEKIAERIKMFDNKLYLEFGGKLFDDYHASRVLPGFEPDSKIKLLLEMKEIAEILIVINAEDIEKNKIRADIGISYDQDVLRLIDAFRSCDLFVGSVVLSQYGNQASADNFRKKLESLGIKVATHYKIAGYPSNIPFVVSDEGLGTNQYIETTRELIVVTAPGPGSGKLATCLSQIYHDHKHGISAGYAKFETFPIWNLPLKHPVNLAYESATADLNDVNMIDPFHLEHYNEMTVNYNRDVEAFPLLNTLFQKIVGTSPYKSPTDMGVNMVGHCIIDNDAAKNASYDEIVRRYYEAICNYRLDKGTLDTVEKLELVMNQAGITKDFRKCVQPAIDKAEETQAPACSIQLNNGQIITGKTSSLFGASSACLINALKILGNISDDFPLIAPIVIEPIQKLKIDCLRNRNPRLHTDEVLIAIAITATTSPIAQRAIDMLPRLKNCEMHSTVLLSEVDKNTLKKLGINLTTEPFYQTKKLYHKK